MGARVDEYALMFRDNKSVFLYTTMSSSVLKKKNCAVSYHKVKEMIVCRVLRFVSIKLEENYADVLTKTLSPTNVRRLIDQLLFRKPPIEI